MLDWLVLFERSAFLWASCDCILIYITISRIVWPLVSLHVGSVEGEVRIVSETAAWQNLMKFTHVPVHDLFVVDILERFKHWQDHFLNQSTNQHGVCAQSERNAYTTIYGAPRISIMSRFSAFDAKTQPRKLKINNNESINWTKRAISWVWSIDAVYTTQPRERLVTRKIGIFQTFAIPSVYWP